MISALHEHHPRIFKYWLAITSSCIAAVSLLQSWQATDNDANAWPSSTGDGAVANLISNPTVTWPSDCSATGRAKRTTPAAVRSSAPNAYRFCTGQDPQDTSPTETRTLPFASFCKIACRRLSPESSSNSNSPERSEKRHPVSLQS